MKLGRSHDGLLRHKSNGKFPLTTERKTVADSFDFTPTVKDLRPAQPSFRCRFRGQDKHRVVSGTVCPGNELSGIGRTASVIHLVQLDT